MFPRSTFYIGISLKLEHDWEDTIFWLLAFPSKCESSQQDSWIFVVLHNFLWFHLLSKVTYHWYNVNSYGSGVSYRHKIKIYNKTSRFSRACHLNAGMVVDYIINVNLMIEIINTRTLYNLISNWNTNVLFISSWASLE